MTARGKSSGKDYTELTKKQMDQFGIKHDELIMNQKPDADVFIDDKGMNVSDWDRSAESVVWLNGCFDILHRGHIEMFKYAANLGCRLVVGTDTDERVRRLKGNSRPINKLEDRIEMLHSLKWIDEVVSFDSDEELCFWLMHYQPKYRVLGGDYKHQIDSIVGLEHSGELKFFDRHLHYSTSEIVDVLRDKKQNDSEDGTMENHSNFE